MSSNEQNKMNATTNATDGANASPGTGNDTEDLAVFVQTLLDQMQSRFQQMSDSIVGRIDEMGSRIDELEKSIGDLMEQSNQDTPTDTKSQDK